MTFFTFIFASFSFADDGQKYEFHHGHKIKKGEFIVKLKNPLEARAKVSSHTTQDFMTKAHSRWALRDVTSFSGINLHQMRQEQNTGKSVDEVIADLQSNPEVEYAEPNYIVEKESVGEPQAQSYTAAQVNSMSNGSYGVTSASIQAQSTWPILISSSTPVVVAVIDSGLDMTHPAFAYSLWTNAREVAGNGRDDDGNGYVDDIHGWNFVANNNNPTDDEGHGTHVSGIVLGVGTNIFQAPTGPTPVQIMPLKFLDSTGSGSTSDAIKAIYYAANNGAFVMNNSWGGGGYSHSLLEAIGYAYNKDAIFAAAAGNAATNNDASPTYPANYGTPNTIAVAATDDYDYLASFSNYGQSSVNLSAPGVAVLSTWPGGYYTYLSGTSMATPFVAGTAALMKYQSPLMNSYQIKSLLLNGVDVKSNLSSYVQTSGRLNVYQAVSLATTTPVDPYKPAYTVPADRSLASTGGGCGMISQIHQERDFIRQVVVAAALLILPLFFAGALKPGLASGAEKRKHPRFSMNSEMKLKIGDQELSGAVKTISMGGSEINTEALLREGSVITMTIASPDGREKIEVQGHVVWSQSQKRYGVAFKDLSESVKTQIAGWTTVLGKAS